MAEPCCIEARLTDGPLPPCSAEADPGAGAVWMFEGVVRPLETGRPLAALVYEAYEPMTTRELRRLAERLAAEHGLIRLAVEHSVGRVAVGERSFRLTVTSAHRREGCVAAAAFIDEMKRYVPLWKNPEFEAASAE